jgi:glycosyltransferase involved in cell wall biosynthesis
LFVGRLHPKKGIDLTLQAFERLATDHPKLNLALVGPDEHGYATSIPAWAQQHGLSQRVHLTGQLDGHDRLAAYADADLFLLLSESENFGMSAAEAMAASVPVVVTDGVGVSAWISDGLSGIVVPPDFESVLRAIRSLLTDPARRKVIGETGRCLAENEFGSDRVGNRMAQEYDKLLRRPSDGDTNHASIMSAGERDQADA